ncbi:unnamed protein product [Lathyrus sativus]|nr:unnamed protein product [Lathyrus sativus]
MSVIVNDSLTKDFKVSRGLRQGDPFPLFLFTIVVEGLTILVRRAVCASSFKEFKFDNGAAHSLLQYVDDTIFIGDGSWSNLWSMKSILVGFELISSLKINLRKSYLFGIMNDDYFMKAAEHFIGCRIDELPLKFLGLTVGGNHRCISFWNPVVKCMKTRLSSWKGSWLSIGGRVTLINSRKFLWVGSKEKRCIAWVSWKSICKSKEEGSLGIKDLGMFNKALLAKWWWRFLTDG